ncbi:sugar transporter [Vibrio astriarenae]|uniref:Sugar transporter n=1 Tax=Vibrio astriarenae TaxID=1481923 RepID=A0A7Z2T5A9_9VIBR|nr:SLBB domain-containing protein [Vibrio astriarenae]QIA64433.1 sugar transporter [Vibrio astriarenae]
MKLLNKITLATTLFASQFAFAAQPTPAQIEQFKKLPKAQQEQLARQYGVDVSMITGAGRSSASSQTEIAAPTRAMAGNEAETVLTDADYELMLKDLTDEQVKELMNHIKLQQEELMPFGYDVLKGSPDSFVAFDNIPVPSDYVVGPGDEIRIQLFGKEDGEEVVTVDRNGQITIPRVGPVNVAGKSFSVMNDELTSLIQERIIGGNVVISMANMRMMQVYVVGEATQPGAYNVNGVTTLTQALIAAGGVKETGSLREVQLKRQGQVVATLDMYDLLLKGDSSNDVRLEKGDTLFIPAKKSNITVQGSVTRPAYYELDRPTLLSTVLNYAGGTLSDAYLGQVTVLRRSKNGIDVKTLDVTKASGKNFKIHNGDVVQIGQMTENVSTAVGVRGEAVRQGGYQFTTGMRISDVFQDITKDLKPTAELDYALVVREINVNKDIEVLQFDLGKAIKSPHSRDDLVLKNRDQIFVFSNNLDVDYWLGKNTKSQAELEKIRQETEALARLERDLAQQQQTVTKVDPETGALKEVTKGSADNTSNNKLNELVQDDELSSRAKELQPIIERLKAQASIDEPLKLVEISGDVKHPGVYPLSKNMEIADLLKAAGGLQESAFLLEAELSRFLSNEGDMDDKNLHHSRIDLSGVFAGNPVANKMLTSKDRLIIFKKPSWQSEMVVELQGEVKFPGNYSINRGETIGDIIERAGGLTQWADPNAAVFSREKLKLREQQQMAYLRRELQNQISGLTLRKNSSSASFSSSPTEAMELVNNLGNTPALGRMVIDMPAILDGSKDADIRLANQDKIYIPEFEKTVSIIGEVQFTSTHTFDNAKTVDDYINLAGGTKKQADTDRVYVVRADGSVMIPNNSYWFSRSSESLRPGDTIIVPIDVDYLDGLSTVTSATQILYQLGVAWSAIKD